MERLGMDAQPCRRLQSPEAAGGTTGFRRQVSVPTEKNPAL